MRPVPLLLALAAGLHLAAMPSHLSQGLLVGGFFLVVAVAQLAAAVLVHRGTGPVMRAVIAAGNLAVVSVWAVSRTAGLGGAPEPVALLDGLAVGAALAAVAGLYLIDTAPRPLRPSRVAGLPALAVVALLAAGISLPLAPAAHSHDEAPVVAPAAPTHHAGTPDH